MIHKRKRDMMKRRIVIAGANGFLGRELSRRFLEQGREVVGLVRSGATVEDGCRRAEWDGHVLGGWAREIDGAGALVNLAGRSVNCRYTPENRAAILESRTASTRILGDAVAMAASPPPVWLNASTATFYRHAEDRPQDEVHGEPGDGFSVEVASAWESAFFRARVPGCTRKAALRTSLVLAREPGTVFDYLWRLARLGLGGAMAGGRQMMSWIHGEDFCRAVEWLLRNDRADGVFNVTAPSPVTNREFMRLMRRAAGMPVGLPAARWMLECGALLMRTETELVTKSRWVVPRRLMDHGFVFRWPDLTAALEDLVPGKRWVPSLPGKKVVSVK